MINGHAMLVEKGELDVWVIQAKEIFQIVP